MSATVGRLPYKLYKLILWFTSCWTTLYIQEDEVCQVPRRDGPASPLLVAGERSVDGVHGERVGEGEALTLLVQSVLHRLGHSPQGKAQFNLRKLSSSSHHIYNWMGSTINQNILETRAAGKCSHFIGTIFEE